MNETIPEWAPYFVMITLVVGPLICALAIIIISMVRDIDKQPDSRLSRTAETERIEMDHLDAIELAMKTAYAHGSIDKGNIMYKEDAGAFFLEGCLFAAKACRAMAERRISKESFPGYWQGNDAACSDIAKEITEDFNLPKSG